MNEQKATIIVINNAEKKKNKVNIKSLFKSFIEIAVMIGINLIIIFAFDFTIDTKLTLIFINGLAFIIPDIIKLIKKRGSHE